MGIGDTVKSMLGHEHEETGEGDSLHRRSSKHSTFSRHEPKPPANTYDFDVLNDPTRITNSNRASHRLPSGTGIGTSGKGSSGAVPAHQTEMEADLERQRTQGIAGYGTDASAAVGGSLASTHAGSRTSGAGEAGGGLAPRTTGQNIHVGPTTLTSPDSVEGQPMGGSRAPHADARTSGAGDPRATGQNIHVGPTSPTAPGSFEGQPMGGSRVADSHKNATPSAVKSGVPTSQPHAVSGHTGVLDNHHDTGHTKRDAMPTGDTVEDTNQLHPVTHERVRHLETEDVERLKDHERHIHHVQHHTQPIQTSAKMPDTHREQVHPVTRIEEQHANKAEDNTLFQGQVSQHHDTLEHTAKERTIVDKGTMITETVHHHIHHVIQPVIERQTVAQEFTHTKIPIHEVTHEAPIVHQSQTHAPIPLSSFVEKGGVLEGGVRQEDISKKVLHGGDCTRSVDGIASDLENTLQLDSQVVNETQPEYITKVTKVRTVAVEEPPLVPPSRN
ncbi:hypothetical protein DFP72DRAFT_895076 [Ephemerocybe angulata]|uniref:Allergen n=1 Tax=Ephemerocybe angulata TaxID=980116 RepID=A0A8H6I1E8_9AGAR|nr:hypothetical protein DFP72DRAFT_895076 [Tulosesus angulatus]